jgi:hypothetical protein
MNSTSTEDSSFTRSGENKENIDLDKDEIIKTPDDDGFKEHRDKKLIKNVQSLTSSSKKNYSDHCFVKTILERNGPIYIYDKNHSKLYISGIKIVNFPMNRNIFDKGKIDCLKYFEQDTKTIPEAKFWYQRYYYYSKFDEGIQMDYESKIHKNFI